MIFMHITLNLYNGLYIIVNLLMELVLFGLIYTLTFLLFSGLNEQTFIPQSI